MIKALLFDLDGFLINSEELYLEANREYFKKYNFEFTEDLHRQGTGKKFANWITSVIPPIGKTGEEILSERNLIFFRLVKDRISLLPGAIELLRLAKQNFKTAIVTSSKQDYLQLVFDITGINMYFDLIISGEMVTKGKPDPEGYLIAAIKLAVDPSECIVFEDAPSGILSGLNAKMHVIAVPSLYVYGDPVFSKADIVKENLREIDLQTINSIAE